MSEKGILKHFLTIGAGTFINLLLGLLTTPIITRLVSPDDYGHLSVFTMYTGLAVMILCCGLDQALVRYYYEEEHVSYKRSLLSKCVGIPFIASVVFGLIVILLSTNSVLSEEFSTSIYVLFSVYVLVELINRFAVLIIRLEYKSKLYSILNILAKLLYILIGIPLVVFVNKNNLIELIVAYIGSQTICLLIGIVSERNKWDFLKIKNDKSAVKKYDLVKYGIPFIFSLGLMTLFQAIDKITLSTLSTYSEVGIYASANSMISIFAVIQTTFNALWGPMAVEHYTNAPGDKSFYQRGNKMITLIMFFIGITLICFKDVFALLLGSKYREAALIVPFLSFSPIMYTISETTVSGLVFMKKSKSQIIVSIGACITNLIGNLILVPHLGGRGAAISTGLSYIVFFSLRTFLSNRYYYIDFGLKKFYFMTLICVGYAFLNTFMSINIFTICGYFVSITILILLYKNELVWGTNYVRDTKKRKG